MENNIRSAQKRALQYWFSDGLAELSGAAIGLLLALFFTILAILPSSNSIFSLLFLILFVAAFGIRKLMLGYRQHSTYPRTGFVEARQGLQDPALIVITIGFSVLLLGFMIFTIIKGIQIFSWLPIIGGVVFCFIFSLAGFRTMTPRFYFLAAFCLILGGILAVCGLGDLWGMALLSLGTCLVLLSYGMITRWRYLSQTKNITENRDEP